MIGFLICLLATMTFYFAMMKYTLFMPFILLFILIVAFKVPIKTIATGLLLTVFVVILAAIVVEGIGLFCDLVILWFK